MEALLSPRSANASLAMSEVSGKKYSDQAIWFMNGFWTEVKGDAEKVWSWSKHFEQLDQMGPTKLGKDGSALDQFWSAKFLEDCDQALSALARKEALREIDQDSDGKMSLIEYCAWKYKKTPKQIADAPQGSNAAQIEKAQRLMDSVNKALDLVVYSLGNLRTEEAKLAVLEKELKQAVAELEAQQAAYDKEVAKLEEKVNNPSTSATQKSKANVELQQLKAGDPMPLRRARITQEAALRKCEKQKKQVLDGIAECERKRADLESQMAKAVEELERAKAAGGGGKGAIWWMQRQLFEADSFLASNKQKYDHKKPFSCDP